ncbi:MAG TPA: hypothetical protein VHC63_17215 [Acidimicrobiales bacterium]|nr:hypothetical protein [Acidimicrobiales bacterium]
MAAFDYFLLTWEPVESIERFNHRLSTLGAEGWEAVSMSPRRTSVPMAGMGADAIADIAVLLKRAVE